MLIVVVGVCHERGASEKVELELGVGVRIVLVVFKDDGEVCRLTGTDADDRRCVASCRPLLLRRRADRRGKLSKPLSAKPTGQNVAPADECAYVARFGSDLMYGVGLRVIEEAGGDRRACGQSIRKNETARGRKYEASASLRVRDTKGLRLTVALFH